MTVVWMHSMIVSVVNYVEMYVYSDPFVIEAFCSSVYSFA